MGDHEARVRKLVTAFNTLSDKSKDALLEHVETLKRTENAFFEARHKNHPFTEFANSGDFTPDGKIC